MTHQSALKEAVERVTWTKEAHSRVQDIARSIRRLGKGYGYGDLEVALLDADALDDALATLFSQAESLEAMASALERLKTWAEINHCDHSETHRGGVLWTICDDCGAKWADDQGGKPDYVEPVPITIARTALSQYRKTGDL